MSSQAGIAGTFNLKSLNSGYSNSRYIANLVQAPNISGNDFIASSIIPPQGASGVFISNLICDTITVASGSFDTGTSIYTTLQASDLIVGTGSFISISAGTGSFLNLSLTSLSVNSGIVTNLASSSGTISTLSINNINSNIIPTITNTFDLGSSSRYISNAYIDNAYVNVLTTQQTLEVKDPIISMGVGNTTDNINEGITLQTATNTWSGFMRAQGTNNFYLFKNASTLPTISTDLTLLEPANLTVNTIYAGTGFYQNIIATGVNGTIIGNFVGGNTVNADKINSISGLFTYLASSQFNAHTIMANIMNPEVLNCASGTFTAITTTGLISNTITSRTINTEVLNCNSGLFSAITATGLIANTIMASTTNTEVLNCNTGIFTSFTATGLTVNSITARLGTIGTLNSSTGIFDNIIATTGLFSNSIRLSGGTITSPSGVFNNIISTGIASDTITSRLGTIGTVNGTTGSFSNVISTTGLFSGSIRLSGGTITSPSGVFNNLVSTGITSGLGTFGTVNSTTGLFSNVISTTGLFSGSIRLSGGTITSPTGIFNNIVSTGITLDTVTARLGAFITVTTSSIASATGVFNNIISTGITSNIITSNSGSFITAVASSGLFATVITSGSTISNSGLFGTVIASGSMVSPLVTANSGSFTTAIASSGLFGTVIASESMIANTGLFGTSIQLSGGTISSTTGLFTNVVATGLFSILKAGMVISSTPVTNNYTATVNDINSYILANSGMILFLPTDASIPAPVGSYITVSQQTAGKVTLAGTGGVSLVSFGSFFSTAGLYGVISAVKKAANSWEMYGNSAI